MSEVMTGDPGREDQIFLEQLRMVYAQTSVAVVGGFVIALLYARVFWAVVDHTLLIVWLCTMTIVLACRIVLYFKFVGRENDTNLGWWSNTFIVFSFLASALWGLTAILFIPAGDVVYNMIVVVWMIGLSAAAVSAYSAYMKAMLAFFLPVMLPAIIHLFVLGGQFNTAVAVACCIYVIVVLRAMMPINRELTRAISTNFRLEDEIKERKSIEEKLREISQQDGLTGLSNRRHFDEIIEAEWRRALRESDQLSLILMDIDYFKAFNDSYGHVEGDRCLRQIGGIIQHVVRRSGDFPARYGGEELVIILPNTDLASAERIAETIRKSVQDLDIDHRGTEIKDCHVVTISAGVATVVPSRDTTPEQFIHTADNAMYLAKEQGRNQVVTAK